MLVSSFMTFWPESWAGGVGTGAVFLMVGLLVILEELGIELAKPFTAGIDWDPLTVTCVAYNYPSLLIFEFRPLSWYCWSFIMSPWNSEGISQVVYCRECSHFLESFCLSEVIVPDYFPKDWLSDAVRENREEIFKCHLIMNLKKINLSNSRHKNSWFHYININW